MELPERSGTIFTAPSDFIRQSYWDRAALREAIPVKRLGNLLIFNGTFYLPGQAARVFYYRGLDKIYGEKPDEAGAEKAFRRSVELDPTAYFVHIELGNLYLKRGSREESAHAYSEALNYARDEPEIRHALQNQIQRVSREALAGITPCVTPTWNDVSGWPSTDASLPANEVVGESSATPPTYDLAGWLRCEPDQFQSKRQH